MRIRRSTAVVGARGVVLDERGFAVPTVLFMLLAALAVVSVGVVATIEAQSGTVRDQQSKSALTSAEGGVSQALLHYNGDYHERRREPGADVDVCFGGKIAVTKLSLF